MRVVHGVYDIESGVVESVYPDAAQAKERAEYIHDITGRKHGVYLISEAPPNVHHWHFRASEIDPHVRGYSCCNPLCNMRPRYWKAEDFGYWSVESCFESVTQQMMDHLLKGKVPGSY